MIWGMKKALQNWNTWLWIGKMSSVWTLFPLTPLCWSLFFLPSVPCAGQAVLQLHGAKQTLGWKAGEGNCSLPQTECLRSRQGCGVSEFGAGEGKCPAEAERHERRVPRRSKEGRLKLSATKRGGEIGEWDYWGGLNPAEMGYGGNLVVPHPVLSWKLPWCLGSPGCWARTIPAMVPSGIARVKNTIPSQRVWSEAQFTSPASYWTRFVSASCVFPVLTNHTDPGKGAHSFSWNDNSVSKMGRGYVYLQQEQRAA